MKSDTEDATMLLTATDILEPLVMRSTNTEEKIIIKPKEFPWVVGNSKKSCDFRINSQVISRVHTRLGEDNGEFYIEDLNSTNGTFVNDKRLSPHQPVTICKGDRITLSNIEFVVE